MKRARSHPRSFPLAAVAFGAALLCVLPPAATAQAPSAGSSGATQVLLEKAHTLEAKGRMDMAAQTWQQVLLADPNNTEALGGLARSAKLSGNQSLANLYLQKLRAINPNDPGIARAEGVMTQSNQLAQLQQAGKLAAAGNYAQSMNIYRQVFGSQPPPGEWSLAYYETEAATEDGRPHAVAGLRSLVDKFPQDSRYQIALGRILTYNPRTRPEGRKLLAAHPNNPEATDALKQSLVWDAQNPATSGEIRAYLQKHPDVQLQQSLRSTEAQAAAARTQARQAGGGNRRSTTRSSSAAPADDDATGAIAEQRALSSEERAAYAALNAKRFDEADTRFKSLLAQDPQNARALAGLGYVRMNQQNFGGAISFLEQAKANGAKDQGLDKNLEISRFYYVLSEGGIALNENDLTTAEQKYQQALQMRPSSPEALQGLGGTLMKAGQPQAAIPYFEKFVRVKPGAASWRSLFMAQYQAGNAAAALATERRIPASIRAQLMRDPEYLRTLASAYSATGRDADAQRILRSALDLPFPAEARGLKAETQLQYASLLLQANRLDQASGLYRQVLADDPNNVLAWQGLVNTQHAMHADQAAMQSIESMPPGVYDQALRDPGFLSSAASVYQANNKLDLAQSLLERSIAAQNTTGQAVPVALQLQLAGLYLQRNDPARAYPIYQRVLSQNPERVDAWRGLIDSLHASGRDQEALAEIQQIPPGVRKQLEDNVEYLQTVGQIYNGLGQPRQSLFFLNRVQQHYAAQHAQPPADIDIQNAWLLYNGMNDTGLYRQLLVLGSRQDLSDDQRRTVQTIWASWAVRRANQASAANNPRRALAILNAAAKAFPDNPAVLRALAGGYQRAGLPKEAVAIFKSQDMTNATAADYKSSVGAALAANDNKDAEVWLRYGLDHYPKDGQLLGLAAKFEQARGDSGRAAEYYKASLAALPPPDPGSELAYILNQPVPLNPRALPSAQQPQDLATLLAPGTDVANGPLAAQAPPRPYLPSAGNAYGVAPVQVGSAVGSANDLPYGATPAVPQYMTNTNRRAVTPSRLRDYVPPPESVQGDPAYGYTVPQGGYAAPAYPQPRGISETEIPADAAPAGLEAQPYLDFQREQVRRAAEIAMATGTTRPSAEDYPLTTASTFREGAQTGAYGNGEVYGPYVPYVAPTTQGAPAVTYSASDIDVPNSTTVFTDFPSGEGKLVQLHPAKTAKTRTKAHHAQDADAEAAEIRRHQSDPPGMSGSSRPPEESADLSSGNQVQYNGQSGASLGSGNPNQAYAGTLSPGTGQTGRPSRIPATSPTNTAPDTGSTSRTITTDFPQSTQTSPEPTLGQQYPQPIRGTGTQSSVRRRPRARASARAVTGFGVSGPPIFYPAVPTALGSEPYPDLPPYNTGQQPPSDAQLVARNVPPLRGRYVPTDPTIGGEGGPPLTERQQTELDLASLEASYSPWLGGTGFVRFRSGQPGIDRLFDYEVPFEASVVAGKTARFTVVPRAVFLDSGTIDTARYTGTNVPYLGTLPASAINTPTPQYASGVGGEIQMVTQNLGVAVGYTPYEFLVNNLTARFRYRPAGGPFTFYGERDSVKETQLSYAGLRDPGSISFSNPGNIWGGVVATGGGIRFDKGSERSGFYLSADGAVLTGYHTLDNTRIEGTGGAYFRVHTFPGIGSLNVGASLFGLHFNHNERALTYGNGGYFSPEIYLLGSVPVTFTGYYKTSWHYVVQAGVGVQTFQEDSAPFYPLDAPTQNLAGIGCTNIQLSQQTCPTAYLPVNTNTGANFSINGEFSYRIAEHWYAGAALSANNTNNYTAVQPTVFLRYLFRAQYPTEEYPTGLFPTEGFRPLRVP